MLGHFGLDEQRGDARIQACGQPIDGHGPDILFELGRVLITRGERMPVGDEEVALVLVLQLDPILQRAVIVPEVQQPARPHSGKNSAILYRSAHAGDPNTLMTRPMTRNAGSNSHPSIPSADKPITTNKPTGSTFSRRAPHAGGNSPASTRPPSSGGIGSRLKIANTTLTMIPACAISAIQ